MASLAEFIRRHRAVFLSFGAIQAMQLLLPLLALPWLARILGPEKFGLLMYMCLFPPLTAMIVDWGLSYGGARESAWLRGNEQGLGKLLGASLLLKSLLALLCLVLACALLPFLPYVAEHKSAYFLAILAGISRGFNPVWFFQGADFGMKKAAIMDVAASLAVLILILFFVRQSDDWPRYLLFLFLCKGIAYGYLLFSLCLRFRPPASLRDALALMRISACFFGSSFSLMLCYNGGQLGLGYFLTAADMGMIVAANKMLRALVSLINPFTLTLFPELCLLRRDNPTRARKILRWSLGLTAGISALASAICCLLAPWLILIGLGSSYEEAAPILRVMLAAAPLMACNNVLANQILSPAGLEKFQLIIQGVCALLAFPLGAALGYFGTIWGASLPVWLEGGMGAGLSGFILKLRPAILFNQSEKR